MRCAHALCIGVMLWAPRAALAQGVAPDSPGADPVSPAGDASSLAAGVTPPAEDATSPMAAGLEALRRSDYASAEKLLRTVTGPQRSAARLALTRSAFEQGHFAEAEAFLNDAAASGSSRVAVSAVRAQVLAAQGKVDAAMAALHPYKDAPGVAGRHVRLQLGELLLRVGRRADAEPVLLQFADEYNNDSIPLKDAEGLGMVARAMYLLRSPKNANRAFNESERMERKSQQPTLTQTDTLAWAAQLYLDKDEPGPTEEVLTEALKIAPNRPDLLVLLAKMKLEESLDFDTAEKLVAHALTINPKCVGAYGVRAAIELRDARLDRADTDIAAGLAVDPNDLELLSLRAASRFLADDRAGFEAALRDVFARNAEYSEVYTMVGEYAEWEHRYDDVIGLMKQAVTLDPHDGKAWAELGLLQTRDGDEAAGLASLQSAWAEDDDNVRVLNTLRLYEEWIPQHYDSARSGVFNIRYPKDEKAILERYVPAMLREAWGSMKLRYMFTPTTPIAIEMYLDHPDDAFSVRTSGLPDVGIQGACFGKVVAAISPNSEPFNWGNVLWHELGHVFAIQLSDSRVPRWFTEGLSEYETAIRRPEWRRELDPELYLALKSHRVPGAADMDTAFTHATGELDVTVAYYAASKMLEFTGETYGFPAIVHALELWGKHEKTADVIHDAFGVDVAHYDEAFRAWERTKLARYDAQYLFAPAHVSVEEAQAAAASSPRDVRAHTTYAVALLRAQQVDTAKQEIQAALQIDAADKDALFIASEVSGLEHDLEAQRKRLVALKDSGGDGYIVESSLAANARGRRDNPAERQALEAAHRFDPTQADPLRRLYEMAHDEHRDSDALATLRDLCNLDQHDRRAWGLLLSGLVNAGRWEEARHVGEAALFVDVESAPVHIDYARALAESGDHAKAVFELESALLCDATQEDADRAKALLAKEQALLAKPKAPRQ